VVSSHLPHTVSTMTLAYTFFRTPTAALPSLLEQGFAALMGQPANRLAGRWCPQGKASG